MAGGEKSLCLPGEVGGYSCIWSPLKREAEAPVPATDWRFVRRPIGLGPGLTGRRVHGGPSASKNRVPSVGDYCGSQSVSECPRARISPEGILLCAVVASVAFPCGKLSKISRINFA